MHAGRLLSTEVWSQCCSGIGPIMVVYYGGNVSMGHDFDSLDCCRLTFGLDNIWLPTVDLRLWS